MDELWVKKNWFLGMIGVFTVKNPLFLERESVLTKKTGLTTKSDMNL